MIPRSCSLIVFPVSNRYLHHHKLVNAGCTLEASLCPPRANRGLPVSTSIAKRCLVRLGWNPEVGYVVSKLDLCLTLFDSKSILFNLKSILTSLGGVDAWDFRGMEQARWHPDCVPVSNKFGLIGFPNAVHF